MNTHRSELTGSPIIIHRHAPAVPVSPPTTTNSVIKKPLPPLPQKASPENKDSVLYVPASPPPPQPPQRIRSGNKGQSTVKFEQTNTPKLNQNSSKNAAIINKPQKFASNNNNQLENASNEVAKLVYKTVMMGSIQNLNSGFGNHSSESDSQNDNSAHGAANDFGHRKLSTSEKNSSQTVHKGSNVQDIVGAMYNTDYKNNIKNTNSDFEMKDRNSIEQTRDATTPTIAPGQFSTNVLLSGAVRNRSTNITSNHQKNNVACDENLPWILLSGEQIIRKDENESVYTDVIFVMPDNRAIRGKLYITNFRIYFRSDDLFQMNYQSHFIIIDLPLGLINRIEKIGHQSSKNNFYGLLISCKNGRRLRFANNSSLNTQDKGARKQIYETIQKYAFPLSNGLNFFAFDYHLPFNETNNGWNLYDVRQEYDRMGITKSNDFRFSKINSDYKFCETYPRVLVVPKSITDDELRMVGEFRSKHRIPVVSWIKYDNKTYRAALLRSSQPLVGLTLKKNEHDEAYLNTFYKLNSNNSLDKLFIVDARPHVNAVANRGAGGGYENEDNYDKCEILFVNIQNIHVMRESFRKIAEMSLPSASNSANSNQPAMNLTAFSNTSNNLLDDKNFFLNLENSKWLEHIRFVLNGALKIVRYISQHRASVLVHCSDGWDRTAQLTSLSMLMMDKYYRTLKGFEILIEKEWLSFGHRFGIRMGHGSDKHSDQDRSPIFLQFIDAVWQILQQNSKVFEFNEKFLLAILQNMYTCQFGTFLYSNENERERNNVKNKTVSLWSYINSHQNEFKNSAYVEYDDVVEFSSTYCSLQLWTQYYFQYKDVIDDSMNDAVITNFNKYRQNQTANRLTTISATNDLAPPQAKLFGQAFFSANGKSNEIKCA